MTLQPLIRILVKEKNIKAIRTLTRRASVDILMAGLITTVLMLIFPERRKDEQGRQQGIKLSSEDYPYCFQKRMPSTAEKTIINMGEGAEFLSFL